MINQSKFIDSSRINIGLEVLRTCICVDISDSKLNEVLKYHDYCGIKYHDYY